MHNLDALGNTNNSLDDVIKQATPFILSYYGQSAYQTMTEARKDMWLRKVSKTIAKAPKLEWLPPTDEAFKENVARAHYQIAVWRYICRSIKSPTIGTS